MSSLGHVATSCSMEIQSYVTAVRVSDACGRVSAEAK